MFRIEDHRDPAADYGVPYDPPRRPSIRTGWLVGLAILALFAVPYALFLLLGA